MRQPKLYSEIETEHGEEFVRQEVLNAIDMRYPLDASDVQDISNEFGIKTEDVMNILQSYQLNKNKEKYEELQRDIKDFLDKYYPSSVDKKPPLFKDFYLKFDKLYSEEDYDENMVKKAFISLTEDPNQMALFEIRKKINRIITEIFNG